MGSCGLAIGLPRARVALPACAVLVGITAAVCRVRGHPWQPLPLRRAAAASSPPAQSLAAAAGEAATASSRRPPPAEAALPPPAPGAAAAAEASRSSTGAASLARAPRGEPPEGAPPPHSVAGAPAPPVAPGAEHQHRFFRDAACTAAVRRVDTWRASGSCADIASPQENFALELVCEGPDVRVIKRGACAGPAGRSKGRVVARSEWEAVLAGQCVAYGSEDEDGIMFAKLSPPMPGLLPSCAGTAAGAGPALPAGGAPCPAAPPEGPRRLGLRRDLPARWAEAFAQDERRKHEPARMHVVRQGNQDWAAKRAQPAEVATVKLVLAVMTSTRHCDIRNAHRVTWMSHKRVCPLHRHLEYDCNVFPVFVFANVSVDNIESANDSVVLKDVRAAAHINSGFTDWFSSSKTHDMWLEGQYKTPAWFRYASKEFSWATHIGKSDLDTYPYITQIWKDLELAPKRELYYGYQGAAKVVLGELYLVTRDVAQCFVHAEANSYAKMEGDPWGHAAEDILFEKLVERSCNVTLISVERSKRWIHLR